MDTLTEAQWDVLRLAYGGPWPPGTPFPGDPAPDPLPLLCPHDHGARRGCAPNVTPVTFAVTGRLGTMRGCCGKHLVPVLAGVLDADGGGEVTVRER